VATKKNKHEKSEESKSLQPNQGVLYWINWIKASKDARSEHLHLTQNAWKEYLGEYHVTSNRATSRQPRVYRFPLFWASIQTIQPAFYSSTPVPIAEAEFGSSDPIASTAATIAERLGKYLVKVNPFDRVLYSTRDDFMLGDKATNRVIYDSEKTDEAEKIYVLEQAGPDGAPSLVDGNGDIIPEGAELLEDEQGRYYEQEIEDDCAKLIPVPMEDILHTPNARHWDEVQAIGFRLCLTRRDATDKFGDDARFLTYGKRKGSDESQAEKDSKSIDPVAEVWEIWDKQDRKVRYVSESLATRYLKPVDSETDEIDDPYKLCGFFPCPPFVLGTARPDSLYPVPLYAQLEDIIKQINGAYKRLCRLIRSTRRRGIFDQNVPELAILQSDADEGEYIPVKGFAQIVGEKGLGNLVQHFPVAELAQALQEMTSAVQTFKDYFYELSGVPDVLRGASDPVETAEAQKIKERHASLRFSAKQKMFQDLVRKDIELLVDLAIRTFEPNKIAEIVGARFMDEADQQNFMPALALLKTDKWKNIRISIETDSTILVNEEADRRKRSELVTSITDAFAQIASIQNLPPSMTSFLQELLIYSVQGMRDSKALIGKLKEAVAQAADTGSTDTPPPPDYEAEKLQLKQFEIQTDAQLKTQELQLLAEKNASDAELKREELAIEAQKVGAEAATAQFKQQLDAQQQSFTQQIETLRVQNEQQKVALDEREKYMTEYRLQAEAARKEKELLLANAANQPQVQPLTIVNEAPKPIKKKYRIVRDALGNADIQSEEIPG